MEYLIIVGKVFAGFCISLFGMTIALYLCYVLMDKEVIKLHPEDIGGGLGYMVGFGFFGFLITAILSYFGMRG